MQKECLAHLLRGEKAGAIWGKYQMYQAQPDLDDTLALLEKEVEEFHRIKESLSATLQSGSMEQVQADAEPQLVSLLD